MGFALSRSTCFDHSLLKCDCHIVTDSAAREHPKEKRVRGEETGEIHVSISCCSKHGKCVCVCVCVCVYVFAHVCVQGN